MSVVDEAQQIEHLPVAQLVPYARNARTHSREQVGQIVASMREFGFTNPILIDADNTIVAGHGRVMALQKIGAELAPCIRLQFVSDAQRRAYILADNQLAANAGWDEALLRVELDEIHAAGFDLGVIGFQSNEIDRLMEDLRLDEERGQGLTDVDEVPEVPVAPRSRLGDLWQLGDHRLLCGDSTRSDDVERLCEASATIDAVWTDPPYNVNYEGAAGKIENDAMSPSEFRAFLASAYASAYTALKPGGPIYVAHSDAEGVAFRRELTQAGFKTQSCLIWVKNSLVLGRLDHQMQHEPILYGWKPGAAHCWYGGRANTSVIDAIAPSVTMNSDGSVSIDTLEGLVQVHGTDLQVTQCPSTIIRHNRPTKSDLHPTMKPVGLVAGMLSNSSRYGDTVLDLFGGSGSTLIACETLGRRARVMEYDPKFVDVIVARWENFTGQKAQRVTQ